MILRVSGFPVQVRHNPQEFVLVEGSVMVLIVFFQDLFYRYLKTKGFDAVRKFCAGRCPSAASV